MIVHRYNHIHTLPCSPCRWHQSMKDGRVSIEGDAVAYTYVPARCPSFGCNKSSLLCSRPPFMLKRSVPVAVGPRCSCHHGLPCRHRQPSANRIFHRPISPGVIVWTYEKNQTNILRKKQDTYNNSRQTIIEKTSAMAVRLMDGFKRVRDAWPVVESRAGRDLGEYIKVGLMLSTRCIM